MAAWAGREDVNSRSIGIEPGTIDGDDEPFADEPLMDDAGRVPGSMTCLSATTFRPRPLLRIPTWRTGRKSTIPGPHFDWHQTGGTRVCRSGPTRSLQGDFMRDAAFFGYPVEAGQGPVLDAFRQRFRPERVSGR